MSDMEFELNERLRQMIKVLAPDGTDISSNDKATLVAHGEMKGHNLEITSGTIRFTVIDKVMREKAPVFIPLTKTDVKILMEELGYPAL